MKPITLTHQTRRGPRRRRHRDHERPARAGRQADLPEHRHPPRPRVAVGRAPDRVRLRPAAQLRQGRACDAARRRGAHDRRPDREPGRLQRVPRGAETSARDRASTLRPRDERKNCRSRDPAHTGARRLQRRRRLRGIDLNRNYGGFWGGPGASPDPRGRHVPRRGPGLRARGAEHPRPHRDAPDHQPHHQPHVLEPRAAPAGRGGGRLPARRAAVQGPRPQMADTTATRTSRRSSSTTRPARPRTGRTGPPAGSASRSRSATSVPSGVHDARRGRVPRPRACRRGGQGRQPRGVLPDARGDGRRARPLGDRGEAPKGATLTIAKAFETETSPVLAGRLRHGACRPRRRFPERLDNSMTTATARSAGT